MNSVERTATRVRGFQSEELDFQLMRLMGACPSGGGSPGEIMAACANMNEDPRDWPAAFGARDDALAEYFADPFGEEVLRLGQASGETFRRAAPHLPLSNAVVHDWLDEVRGGAR